jgi:hypothetical protein
LKKYVKFLELFKINFVNLWLLSISKWNLKLFKLKGKNSSKWKLKEVIF